MRPPNIESVCPRSVALAVTLLVAAWPAAAQEYVNVSVSEAHELWQSGVFVLDVRTASEYNAGHIPGAYNIDSRDLVSRIGEISERQDDDILVYCASGGRSRTASATLAGQGFTGVHNMEVGFSTWVAVGYETGDFVDFPDSNLEAAVRDAIDKPDGFICTSDVVGAGFSSLDASASNISDLTGIEFFTDLNQIDLSYNSISDIAALVENAGLGQGDIIDLSCNPLGALAVNEHIPILQGNGVEVLYSVDCEPLYGDVNSSSTVDAADIQLVINAALGLPVDYDCDLNDDGFVNAIDVQLGINAALGL